MIYRRSECAVCVQILKDIGIFDKSDTRVERIFLLMNYSHSMPA